MPDPDQAPKYPIPKPIRRSYEIMPGWGMQEIRTAAKGLAIAAPLAGLVYWVGGGIFGTVFGFLAPTAIGIALAYPVSAMDGSMADRLHRASAYKKRPQTWIYDWKRSDLSD